MQLTKGADHHPQTGRRVLICILLLLAAAEFVVRGPARNLYPTNWNDLAQYYAASRIWLRGQNFANPENFGALWRNEVGETLATYTARTHIAPPPGALVLFAPIAALSWPAAKLVWLGVLLASFAAIVLSLIRYAGFAASEPRTLLFVAGCLALAPFHTGIASANQTILVVGFCAVGIWAAKTQRDILSGILFGAACSLKPHIAAFLLLYYLVRRRWRLLATAVAFTCVLVLVAVGWMKLAGVDWLPDYLNNIRFATAKNRIDDFTTANPIRFMLINLQVPIFSFTHSAKSANLVAGLIGVALIVLWTILVFRSRDEEFELLALASIGVIGLLPLYHRLYDASVLAIPLCWCLSRPTLLKRITNIALILMVPFLVPGAALLQQAVRQGSIPDVWTRSWWWDRFVMPHETWFLLLLAVVLLYGMAMHPASNRPTS